MTSIDPGTQIGEREPRTSLGRRLQELREEIVLSGTKLLSWDEIAREVTERRGEPSTSECA